MLSWAEAIIVTDTCTQLARWLPKSKDYTFSLGYFNKKLVTSQNVK